jgi:hypothetical protein
MGREVRMVPANWIHPKNDDGQYEPLMDYFDIALNDFQEMEDKEGLQEATDYYGQRPVIEDYMPSWSDEERTHYMMYEDTSEGTPISPAFASPEELAMWLEATGASSFGSRTANYDHWLRVAKGGFAPSAVVTSGVLKSGVEAL